MKILDTNQQFEQAILKMASDKPSFFYLATFNIRISKFTTQLFNLIPKECKTELIIGLSDRTSKKQINFLYEYFKQYKHIKVKFVANFHTKLVITNKLAILGGRNLTSSDWYDLSFVTESRPEISKIRKKFEKMFGQIKKSF